MHGNNDIKHTKLLLKRLTGRDHIEGLGVEGTSILKQVSRESGGRGQTGIPVTMTGTGGGTL
jgi:hypothetical protein